MDTASWRTDVSHAIEGLGFKMCCTNKDVWFRPAVDNLGNTVNECVLAYTDDLLVHALDPAPILLHIDQHSRLKDRHIGSPTRCLDEIGTPTETDLENEMGTPTTEPDEIELIN